MFHHSSTLYVSPLRYAVFHHSGTLYASPLKYALCFTTKIRSMFHHSSSLTSADPIFTHVHGLSSHLCRPQPTFTPTISTTIFTNPISSRTVTATMSTPPRLATTTQTSTDSTITTSSTTPSAPPTTLHLFTFHLGFVHPLQDVTLHQCFSLSPVYYFPVPGGSLLLCCVILPSSAWSSH